MQFAAGKQAESSGWHEDRPMQEEGSVALLHWQCTKLMLMVTELAEAVEELRAGRAVNETYYSVPVDGLSLAGRAEKPEGVPSELADTVIRIMDFCYTEEIDLASMIVEKLQFNATRGQRHGGKAV